MSKHQKDRLQLARAEMRERKIAYTQVFGVSGPSNKLVMEDLSRFCREKSSTFHPDPRIHALLEGRRECVLRIRDFIDLEIDQLVLKYGEGKNAF
jgi:hypothetical protein